MYLIYVKKNEDSLTMVENNFVVCDQKTVEVGDNVKFLYSGKIYEGMVKLITGRLNFIFLFCNNAKKTIFLCR